MRNVSGIVSQSVSHLDYCDECSWAVVLVGLATISSMIMVWQDPFDWMSWKKSQLVMFCLCVSSTKFEHSYLGQAVLG